LRHSSAWISVSTGAGRRSGESRHDAGFLAGHAIAREAITIAPPTVTDLHAQSYGDKSNILFRYTGSSTVTVYSGDVAAVRAAMHSALKLDMIEEATKNARSVAEKSAADSESRLGKIRSTQQGQFSIENRDNTTPHIKKVRVVSTVEYYLAD